MDPDLLDLVGRCEHQAVEAAIDAVGAGRWPGWRVAYDEIGLEMVAQGRQRASLIDLVVGIDDPQAILTRTRAETPQRVWVIVLEHGTDGRREVVKFLLAGGDEENPLWVRIRPDASVPVQPLP